MAVLPELCCMLPYVIKQGVSTGRLNDIFQIPDAYLITAESTLFTIQLELLAKACRHNHQRALSAGYCGKYLILALDSQILRLGWTMVDTPIINPYSPGARAGCSYLRFAGYPGHIYEYFLGYY
eukprot:6188141-Pleurochrysis_carterae.AAC.1